MTVLQKLSICAAISMAIAAIPAIGQETGTGTLIPGRETSSPIQTPGLARPRHYVDVVVPGAEARMKFHSFAKCVVERDRKAVHAYVLSTKVWEVSAGRLWPGAHAVMDKCLGKLGGGTMHGKAELFAGAFARELYVSEFSILPALSQSSILPAAESQGGEPSDWIPLEFAECLTLAAPANVDHLVRTPPESQFEKDSLTALSGFFEKCIPGNAQLKTTPFNLRILLGWVLYRHAVAGTADVAGASQ